MPVRLIVDTAEARALMKGQQLLFGHVPGSSSGGSPASKESHHGAVRVKPHTRMTEHGPVYVEGHDRVVKRVTHIPATRAVVQTASGTGTTAGRPIPHPKLEQHDLLALDDLHHVNVVSFTRAKNGTLKVRGHGADNEPYDVTVLPDGTGHFKVREDGEDRTASFKTSRIV